MAQNKTPSGFPTTPASNPTTPLETLTLLASSEKFYVRADVAANPSTPPDLLHQLAQDESESVRIEVIQSPNISPETVLLLSKNPTPIIAVELVDKISNIPAEALVNILAQKNLPFELRHTIRRHPKMTVEALVDSFRIDPSNEFVNIELATNPNTPTEVLQKLFTHPQTLLFWGSVGSNPSLTTPMLEQILDKASTSHMTICKNPGASNEVLEQIFVHALRLPENSTAGWIMKTLIAKHPNASSDLLLRLIHETRNVKRIGLVGEILTNKNTTLEVLEALAPRLRREGNPQHTDCFVYLLSQYPKYSDYPEEWLSEMYGL